jgi:hypothetical protein
MGLLVTLVLTSPALAGPGVLTYQGSLLFPNRQPAADGAYAMRFSLYDRAVGGATLWSETDPAVNVAGGLFSTLLGDGPTSFTTEFSGGAVLWLEVAIDFDRSGMIDGTEVFAPRQRVGAVARAFEADTLDGRHAAEFQRRVLGAAPDGSFIRAINEDGSVQTAVDRVGSSSLTGVAAGMGLLGGGTSGTVSLAADMNVLQRRVSGSAPAGSFMRAINADGSIVSGIDQVGAGDITAVIAGLGLLGGATSGTAALAADPTVLQRRVAAWAGAGQYIRAIHEDGGITTGTDQIGSGDITGITAGTGLTGGGTSGSVLLAADTSYLQRRVSGAAGNGEYIRAINGDGSVTTATDQIGSGDITAVSSGTGLTGGGTSGPVALAADTSYLQRRVSGAAGNGQYIRAINGDGTVVTAPDQIGSGDITGITAGTGLTGGGTSGSVLLAADTSYLQRRVSGAAGNGQYIRAINGDGSVTTATDQIGSGDITAVSAGTGLTGGGTSGPVALAADTTVLQRRVTGSAPDGSYVRAINEDGNVVTAIDQVGAGDITGVAAGDGLAGGGTSGSVALAIDPTVVQRRVIGSAGAGQFIQAIHEDGAVTTGTDQVGAGDITEVAAGTGLTGGGTSGPVTLAADTTVLQRRVSGAAPAGQYIQAINEDGTIAAGVDQVGAGDITAVAAGDGLTGGGTSGPVALAVAFGGNGAQLTAARSDHQHDADYVNEGQPGSISAGMLVDGAALAELADNDGSGSGLDADFLDGLDSTAFAPTSHTHASLYWSLTGNAATSTGLHFLGTTDARPFELRVNDTRVLRYEPVTTSPPIPNIIGGRSLNYVAPGVYGATIGGGGDFSRPHIIYDAYGVIGGGRYNRAGNATGNLTNGAYATVGGGYWNTASGFASTVAGGELSTASALDTTVGGGSRNVAGGDLSTVAGGWHNQATAASSTIGGGADNKAAGGWATIAGGSLNNAYGAYSTVAGGARNSAPSTSATVAGGSRNTAGAGASFVGGGVDNRSTATYASVLGGRSNAAWGQSASVPGGEYNTASGTSSLAAGRRAKALHNGSFVWADTTPADFTSQRADQFRVRADGGARFDVNGGGWLEIYTSGPQLLSTSSGAYLSTSGLWTDVSDRRLKTDFRPVFAREALERVARLPIATWSFLAEAPSVRHMGPVAQDFHAAFGLGPDDRHIASLDAAGVALAAIQGLNELVEIQNARIREQQGEIESLRKENAEMRARLAQIESIVSRLGR